MKSRIRTAGLEGPLVKLHEFGKDVSNFTGDPTGRFWVAVIGRSANARLVIGEVRAQKLHVLQEITDGHSPSRLSFSADGSVFATGNRDGTVSLYRVEGAK